jgi:MFS family permease
MNPLFLTIVIPIAAIFSCRMLGLFMLIPVFTIFATDLTGATPALIGLALGSYGLSQGLLQIPFGLLSDRYGRKPILMMGLLIFALGSFMGAISHSITGIIIARTLQGMGAIGSVLIALLADLTSEKQRTFAMAIIGASIGLSFAVAFIISPFLAAATGLSGIFYFTAILAILALILLFTVIPTPKNTPVLKESYGRQLKRVLINPHLLRLNAGIFCQHLLLTATFFSVPLRLQQSIAEGHLQASWHFYLPILCLSFIVMLPLIYLAEKKGKNQFVFTLSVLITTLCQASLLLSNTSWMVFAMIIFVYFIAFNTLEAMLPSMISKQAPANNKGAAMGVYSSSQFLGIFAGGSLAGVLYQGYGHFGIFAATTSVSLLWLLITSTMKFNQPTNCSTTHDSV